MCKVILLSESALPEQAQSNTAKSARIHQFALEVYAFLNLGHFLFTLMLNYILENSRQHTRGFVNMRYPRETVLQYLRHPQREENRNFLLTLRAGPAAQTSLLCMRWLAQKDTICAACQLHERKNTECSYNPKVPLLHQNNKQRACKS